MSKQKKSEPEKHSERKKQSVPDTGQGAAGDWGSDAAVGEDSGSTNNQKTKKDKHKSLIPVKRKDKTEASS